MLATRAKTKKKLKTTKIKPEKNQTRRESAVLIFSGFIFGAFFQIFFSVFARVANIIFQFLYKVPFPTNNVRRRYARIEKLCGQHEQKRKQYLKKKHQK